MKFSANDLITLGACWVVQFNSDGDEVQRMIWNGQSKFSMEFQSTFYAGKTEMQRADRSCIARLTPFGHAALMFGDVFDFEIGSELLKPGAYIGTVELFGESSPHGASPVLLT